MVSITRITLISIAVILAAMGIENLVLSHYKRNRQPLIDAMSVHRRAFNHKNNHNDTVHISTFHIIETDKYEYADYCQPIKVFNLEKVNISVPVDMEEGLFSAPSVLEWEVEAIKRECYHDFLIRKWKTVKWTESEHVTSGLCQETDKGSTPTNISPECTLFDGQVTIEYVGDRFSTSVGKVRLLNGEYWLSTPRSHIKVDLNQLDQPRIVASNGTCVKYNLMRRSMCVGAYKHSDGVFRIYGAEYKVLDEANDGHNCKWLSGGFIICDCLPSESVTTDRPLYGRSELEFEVATLADKAREQEKNRFCHICEDSDMVSPTLEVACKNGTIYNIHVDERPMAFRYEEGYIQNDDYVFDPVSGLAGPKGLHKVHRFEHLPERIYVVNGTNIHNCTLKESRGILQFACLIVPFKSIIEITQHAYEYVPDDVFTRTPGGRFVAAQHVAMDLLGDAANYISGWASTAFGKIVILVTFIGVIALGYVYFASKMRAPRPSSTERIAAHGTRIRYSNVPNLTEETQI